MTITFDHLHVINDGGENHNTAEFRAWVMEGETPIKDFLLGDVDDFEITDRPDEDGSEDDMELIPLATRWPPVVIGPKDTTDDSYDIGVLTRGLCHQDFGSNERSRNYFSLGDTFPSVNMTVPRQAQFPFPTGGGEIVTNRPFVVTTRPDSGIEFQYDVQMRFSVEYF